MCWQESECRQDARILTLLCFSSSERWSVQYVWCWKHQLPELCLRLCSLASGRGSLRSFGHIKRYQNFYSWGPNVVLFTVSVFLPFLSPPVFPIWKHPVQISAGTCCERQWPCLTSYAAFLPTTTPETITFKQALLFSILCKYVDFTFSAAVKSIGTFFLLLQSVRLDGIILNLYFSLLNNSFKKSTFHGEYMCIICWLVLALLFIYINIYI